MGVCLHVRARAHCLPLTTPPSTSAPAPPPPPPPHTNVDVDACRTQCGRCAVCCEGRLAEWAGGVPTGVSINCKHARRGPAQRTSRPSCARHCHKNANTNKPGTKSRTRGAGRGAVRYLQVRDAVCLSAPFAQPRPLADVPANCAVQPALPYAFPTRCHINLTVPETAELPITICNLLQTGGHSVQNISSQYKTHAPAQPCLIEASVSVLMHLG